MPETKITMFWFNRVFFFFEIGGDPGLIAMNRYVDGWMWCVHGGSFDCWSVGRLVYRDDASDVGSFEA